MKSAKVFSDGKVHVLDEMCATCIFRPGNLMHLNPGRVAGMVREAQKNESAITCHGTLYGEQPQEAICRGYFDRYWPAVFTLRLAKAMGIIEEVTLQ